MTERRNEEIRYKSITERLWWGSLIGPLIWIGAHFYQFTDDEAVLEFEG